MSFKGLKEKSLNGKTDMDKCRNRKIKESGFFSYSLIEKWEFPIPMIALLEDSLLKIFDFLLIYFMFYLLINLFSFSNLENVYNSIYKNLNI
jgi:hypothetical protein